MPECFSSARNSERCKSVHVSWKFNLCDALHKFCPNFPTYSICEWHDLFARFRETGNCNTCTYHKAQLSLNKVVRDDLNKDVLWCESIKEENTGNAHSRRNASREADTFNTTTKTQPKKICRVASLAEAINSLLEKMLYFFPCFY